MRIESMEESQDVREELEDRYGNVPVSVDNLLAIARIRGLCVKLKVSSIAQIKEAVVVKFHCDNNIQGTQLAGLAQKMKHRLVFSGTQALQINYKTRGLESRQVLQNLEEMLKFLLSEGK